MLLIKLINWIILIEDLNHLFVLKEELIIKKLLYFRCQEEQQKE